MLDYNVEVGNIILPLVLDLLQHCPAPQKAVMENQPIDYTLYFLEPHCRQAWLTSLLVILYKVSTYLSLYVGFSFARFVLLVILTFFLLNREKPERF